MTTREVAVDSRRAVALVAKREITTRVRGKAFRISTLVMLIGIIATVLISKAVSGSDNAKDVGFVAGQQASAPALVSVGEAIGSTIHTPTVATREAGEQQLRDGKLDALVIGTTADGSLQVEAKKKLDTTVRNALTVLTQRTALDTQLRKAGVDPASVSDAVSAARLEVTSLQRVDPDEGQKLAIGIIAGIAVYLALVVYGQAVAQGVVEEKTSRIVELLLTAIRPWQLMLGKVLGIGALGLAQLLLVGVVGIALGAGTGVLDLPSSVTAGALLTLLVWFLLGYIMYALLFAALGALVSRQEDVGGAVAPLTMLIVIPYVIGISTLPSNPDSSLIEGLSFIPLFSPTLLPMRIAGGVPGWQMGLTIALSLALIAGLVWFAGRVYGNAVTRTGARVKITEALRPI